MGKCNNMLSRITGSTSAATEKANEGYGNNK